jgi:hypothetical protein
MVMFSEELATSVYERDGNPVLLEMAISRVMIIMIYAYILDIKLLLIAT